jgi:hypothetical protein
LVSRAHVVFHSVFWLCLLGPYPRRGKYLAVLHD